MSRRPSLQRREQLLQVIARKPGIHTRELARECGLALRTARYHVDQLARSGRVVIRTDGRYRRLFGPGADTSAMDTQAALMRRVPGLVLTLLMDGNVWTRHGVSAVSGIPGSTLGGALVHLHRSGLVERELRGSRFLYRARDPALVRSLVAARLASTPASGEEATTSAATSLTVAGSQLESASTSIERVA